MVKSGETATFTYNADGLRVKKVCTTTGTTNYTLHGKNVVHLSNGSNNLHFFYDAQNRPAVVVFNGTAYGYVHNLQGDIVAIVNSAGTKVVEYTYDPWGKPLSKTGSLAATLGTLNPFRYRGYIYDEETGTYYLKSRVYSPVLIRFISADKTYGALGSLANKNIFAYCNNNPVCCSDTDGMLPVDDLNQLAQQYASGLISEVKVASDIIQGNGKNYNQAFHEIAQVHAYAYLSHLGISVELEAPIRFGNYLFGEMDISCSIAVWEVKPEYIGGYWQCWSYAAASGKWVGASIVNIDNIYVSPGLHMNLHSYFFEPGVIHYELETDKMEKLKNAAAKVLIGAALLANVAVTLFEDVITFGGGIGNDAPAFDALKQHFAH